MTSKPYRICIEEVSAKNEEESLEDFALHFYYTRYSKMKGVPMYSFNDLLVDFQKNLEKMSLSDDTTIVWSMNWYSLYTAEGKTRALEYEERLTLDKLVNEYDRKKGDSTVYNLFLSPIDATRILVAVSFSLLEVLDDKV